MVTVLLAAAALALPPGFTEAKVLEPAASYVAGKPVAVACSASQASWTAYWQQVYGVDASPGGGTTAPGDDTIHLSPRTCAALRARLRTLKRPAAYGTASAVQILAHESVIARGESDEGVIDCAAYKAVPYVGTHFFGVKHGLALRAFMSDVDSFRSGEPDALHAVC